MPYSANSLISGLDALTIAGGDLLVLADITDSNRAKKLTADELDTYLSATTKTLTNKTLVAPALGTPASGVLTNCTGTASGLTAGNVTTNANLTGHITSTGNATVLGSFTFAQLNTAVSDAEIARTSSTNTFTGVQTFSSDPLIPDEAYGSGWNGVLEPPTKNAVYDKIESLPNSDVTYFLGAGNATTTKEYFVYQAFFGNSLWTLSNSALTDKSYYATRTISSASNYSIFEITTGAFGNYNISGGKKIIIEFFARLNSVGTNTVKFGFAGSVNAFFGAYNETSFDCAFFAVHSTGDFYSQTSQGSSVTNTAITGITLTDFNRYRIEINPTVDVKYYVNGVLKVTDTTNLPDGALTYFGIGGAGNTTNLVNLISLPTIAVEI